MYNLYVPHIDKTGGQSVERIIWNGLEKSGWTYDHNAGDNFPTPMPVNYARLGMHQTFDPKIINVDWFKLLVIREPLDRFVSSYNFFRFEVWRDTKEIIDMSVEEFVLFTIERNAGTSEPNHLDFYRGYVSMLTAMNAEQKNNEWKWSHDTLLSTFDTVIDTTRIDELDEILEPFGIIIDTSLHVNTARQHFKTMGLPEYEILTREMLTDEQRAQIRMIPDYQSDLKIWKDYDANYR